MLKEDLLAKSLISAREKRGWSIWQATQKMDGVWANSLRTLEGLNPDRDPSGPRCKLETAMEIIQLYWPDVTLEHFMERPFRLKLVPKNTAASRHLKGYLAKTG